MSHRVLPLHFIIVTGRRCFSNLIQLTIKTNQRLHVTLRPQAVFTSMSCSVTSYRRRSGVNKLNINPWSRRKAKTVDWHQTAVQQDFYFHFKARRKTVFFQLWLASLVPLVTELLNQRFQEMDTAMRGCLSSVGLTSLKETKKERRVVVS